MSKENVSTLDQIKALRDKLSAERSDIDRQIDQLKARRDEIDDAISPKRPRNPRSPSGSLNDNARKILAKMDMGVVYQRKDLATNAGVTDASATYLALKSLKDGGFIESTEHGKYRKVKDAPAPVAATV